VIVYDAGHDKHKNNPHNETMTLQNRNLVMSQTTVESWSSRFLQKKRQHLKILVLQPVVYAENFHGGGFIQWHMVVI